jgi:cation transport ATPase
MDSDPSSRGFTRSACGASCCSPATTPRTSRPSRARWASTTRGDLLPEHKVDAVRALEREGHRVLMVGDGTNDAPALSSATVGIALAAHGGGISAEAADVVLLTDDVTRVADAVEIGQRAVRVARQSIGAGLLLSGTAMVFAALGHIPPTLGAFIQEAIDVAVILNALRAAHPGRRAATPAATAGHAALASPAS